MIIAYFNFHLINIKAYPPGPARATMDATMDAPDRPNDPSSCALHRQWTLFYKKNADQWDRTSFRRVGEISNVKEMWQLLNYIPANLAGHVNIFFMDEQRVPLWEEHGSLFKDGGCWSTVVKGTDWTTVTKEICMIVFGETVFDDALVKGICVVPVKQTHSIVKIWTTTSGPENGRLMESALNHINIFSPRFKKFT